MCNVQKVDLCTQERPSLKTNIALIVVTILVFACAKKPADSSTASEGTRVQLVNPGKLTVCTNVPFEPFQFYQGTKVVGFDVDIVDLAARDLGVTQEIV